MTIKLSLVPKGLAVLSSSSPCLIVLKSNGSAHFCTDYRKVNTITKPDYFPFPRMEDCVNRVVSATFITKLNLLKVYWLLALTPSAAEISVFATPDNLLQYTVMAFRLRNAPVTLQHLMNKVLAGILHCGKYLGNIVIYSSEWDEHVKSLCAAFNCLQAASLTLNLAKYELIK